jgi:hypothetical protein
MDEDLKELFISRFDRIETKLDIIAAEHNRVVTKVEILDRDNDNINDDLKDLKNNYIPKEIKAGNQKMKIWMYTSVCGILISVVLSLLFRFVI